MKTHLIKEYYYTGIIKTHFKTICGKIRHVFTDLPVTNNKNKVTCKVCNCKEEPDTVKELNKLLDGQIKDAWQTYLNHKRENL